MTKRDEEVKKITEETLRDIQKRLLNFYDDIGEKIDERYSSSRSRGGSDSTDSAVHNRQNRRA